MTTDTQTRKFAQLLLLIVPIILVMAGLALLAQIMPVYAGAYGYDQDPAYVYLLNGLLLLDGHTPQHIDHPGTPLQVLIALAAIIYWLFISLFGEAGNDVVNTVLSQPESFVEQVSIALMLMNVFAAWFLGKQIYKATKSYQLAMSCQFAPLVFWIVAPRFIYLSPEALLVFASLLLLGLLIPLIISTPGSGKRSSGWTPILVGLLCGFGIAVKVTFIPLLGLILLLKNWKQIAMAVVSTAIAFAICLLPILSELARMAGRLYFFASHSGNYGKGEQNVIDLAAIPERIVTLVNTFPFFYLIIVTLIVVPLTLVIVKRFPPHTISTGTIAKIFPSGAFEKHDIKVPLILAGVGLIQTILVLKHPGPHYMMPALPIALIGMTWLARQFNTNRIANTVILGFCALMAANSFYTIHTELKLSRTTIDATTSAIQQELDKYDDPLVVGTYRCVSQECALAFGVSYAPQLKNRTAIQLSNFYEYNIWNHKLMIHGKGWVRIESLNEQINSGRDVFLLSPYRNFETLTLDTLVETKTLFLHRITGVITKQS